MKELQLGSWINIGENNLPAVVCNFTDEENIVEVVFLADGNKAINDLVIYKNGRWEFYYQHRPSGGYADNNSRLQEYVAILRRGKHFHY